MIRRERLTDIYIGPERVVHLGVYVAKVGCTPLRIVVAAGSKTITRTASFRCGE